jgi:hypothetical protein
VKKSSAERLDAHLAVLADPTRRREAQRLSLSGP